MTTALVLCHPVNAESLGWISGRSDSLGAMFVLAALGSLAAFRRSRRWGWLVASTFFYLAGVFTKEFALFTPCFALLLEASAADPSRTSPRFRPASPYVAWLAVGAAYLICRRIALGSFTGTGISPVGELAARQLEYLRQASAPLGQLLPALPRRFVPGATLLLIGLLAGVALLACWRAPAASGARFAGLLGAGWYLMGTIALIFVQYTAARHLLLAIVGPCIVLAGIVAAGARRVAIRRLAAIVLVAWSTTLTLRLLEWSRAGHVSRRALELVIDADAREPAGKPLILDVPPWTSGGAYVWSFASPFALRPPFASSAIDGRRSVLTPAPVDFHPEAWADRVREFESRLDERSEGILIVVDERGQSSTTIVPATTLRAAVERLRRAILVKSFDDAWRDFRAELSRR
jgi:hypothetical protein